MTEQKNVFQRAQARTTLADDRKTKFGRATESRNKKISDTSDRDARITRNQKQRSAWSGDGRTGGTKATTVLLDPETQRLRSKMEAEKRRPQAAQSAPPAPPSPTTLAAIILQWEQNHTTDYYRSAFNAEQMKKFLLANIKAGTLVWSYEALDVAYQWLRENNYLEDAPKPRKRGDLAMHAAPKVFPPLLSDAEIASEGERQRIEQNSRIAPGVANALSLPFDELRKQVRASLPRYGETL